jgi:hypothetical protein
MRPKRRRTFPSAPFDLRFKPVDRGNLPPINMGPIAGHVDEQDEKTAVLLYEVVSVIEDIIVDTDFSLTGYSLADLSDRCAARARDIKLETDSAREAISRIEHLINSYPDLNQPHVGNALVLTIAHVLREYRRA